MHDVLVGARATTYFVGPGGISGPALRLARTAVPDLAVLDGSPAAVLGAPPGSVLLLDVTGDLAAASGYTAALRRLGVTLPVLAIVSTRNLPHVTRDVATDLVLPSSTAGELALRVRRLHSSIGPERRTREVGGLVLDPIGGSLRTHNFTVPLTRIEADVLNYFFARPDAVVSREELSAACWPDTDQVGIRHVDVFICRLRRKLGQAGERIETVRRVGYRFTVAADAAAA